MSPDQQPATKQDLAELESRIVEQMRDMQTEILRGLEAFGRGNFTRMHNLDNQAKAISEQYFATNERISALEERVLNLETRRPRP